MNYLKISTAAAFVLLIAVVLTDIFSKKTMVVPEFLFTLAAVVCLIEYYQSPDRKFLIMLSEIRRTGREDELVDEFRTGEPFFDDSIRLGKKYIFGKGMYKFIEVNKIKKIYRLYDKGYQKGYIVYSYFIFGQKLCGIESEMCTTDLGDKLWSVFSEDLRQRSSDIKIIEKVKIEDRKPECVDRSD